MPNEDPKPEPAAAPKPGEHGATAVWAAPADGGRLEVVLVAVPWVFAPPDPADDAAIDWSSALDRYRGGLTPRAGVGPLVTLARLRRDPRYSGSIRDQPCAGVKSRLVYVLKWSAVPLVFSGGPAPSGRNARGHETTSSSEIHIGFWICVMDANSGEHIFVRQTNQTDRWTDF